MIVGVFGVKGEQVLVQFHFDETVELGELGIELDLIPLNPRLLQEEGV